MITYKLDEVVGCWGEGDSLYKIVDIKDLGTQAYLESFANSFVDAGWQYVGNLRKVKTMKKIKSYRVEFEK